MYGIPEYNCAILATFAPPPGGRTFPTAISLLSALSKISPFIHISLCDPFDINDGGESGGEQGTITHPIFEGSTFDLTRVSLNTAASRSSGTQSLKPPFLACSSVRSYVKQSSGRKISFSLPRSRTGMRGSIKEPGGKSRRMLTHPCYRCPNGTDDNDIIS